MDLLYRLYATIAGLALVLIALIIPWGVFTRYALNSASSWPEPAAILLSIVLTFFGAAAGYRVDLKAGGPRLTLLMRDGLVDG